MLVMMILLVLSALVIVGLLGGLMWLLDRALNRWWAIGLGLAGFLYFAQNMVRGMLFCAVEPQAIPPTPAEAEAGWEGRIISNCDSAGGVLDRFYLYFVAPAILIMIGVLVRKFFNKVSKTA